MHLHFGHVLARFPLGVEYGVNTFSTKWMWFWLCQFCLMSEQQRRAAKIHHNKAPHIQSLQRLLWPKLLLVGFVCIVFDHGMKADPGAPFSTTLPFRRHPAVARTAGTKCCTLSPTHEPEQFPEYPPPRGGGMGDCHLVNTKSFVTAHCVVVWVTVL